MSTNINVVVGGDSLPQRARAQTAANRQARVEDNNTSRAAKNKPPQVRQQQQLQQQQYSEPPPRPKEDPAAWRLLGRGAVFLSIGIADGPENDGNGPYGFYFRVGAQAEKHFVEIPVPNDFEDLLLPYITGNVVPSLPAFGPNGNVPKLDTKGRYLGAIQGYSWDWETSGLTKLNNWTLIAAAPNNSYNYKMEAMYPEIQQRVIDFMPYSNGKALLVVGSKTIKFGWARVRRYDYGAQGLCSTSISPKSYFTDDLQIREAESYKAFMVTNTKVQDLGDPPTAWLNAYKNSKRYLRKEDCTEPVFNGQVNSPTKRVNMRFWDLETYGDPSNGCGITYGDTAEIIPFPKIQPPLWFGLFSFNQTYINLSGYPSLSDGALRSYKLIADTFKTITPSVYQVIKDFDNKVPDPEYDPNFGNVIVPTYTDQSMLPFIQGSKNAATIPWHMPHSKEYTSAFNWTVKDFAMYKSLLAAPTSWDYAGPLYLTDKENQDESDWTRHSKPPFTKQAYESAAAAVAYPEDRYIAWNWDDPGYCKQQASLLGF